MSDFSKFAALVHAQYQLMAKGELYTTNITGDDVYAAYLASFPEGSNPIYRERTEHDCSCCKNFIRNIGNVVAIVNGQKVSVWDVIGVEAPYNTVTEILAAIIRGSAITGLFRTSEHKYGAEKTVELLKNGDTHTWNHFHGAIADKHYSLTPERTIGEFNNISGVFKRGLNELLPTAFADVIELIQGNLLYRGTEFLPLIKEFQKLQSNYQLRYLETTGSQQDLFIWENAGNRAAGFRNTVIGTLIQDLSEGMPMEQAVKGFEGKVAPTNYKRPTSLITPSMVNNAMKTIKDLGLEESLERRFARISDVSINNVLWADGTVKPMMKGGIEGLLMGAAKAPVMASSDKAEDISIMDFMSRVLPQASSIDMLVKNTHQSNFMSITAPVHPSNGDLFKWDNNFAWSYDGNITDSIKERVKAAGGNTNAVMRVSLAWFNHDDLDIHAIEPNGYEIYFGSRSRKSPGNNGCLDVDMNAGRGTTREPVENIVWDTPKDGVYKIVVNNYMGRDASNKGFTLEVENNGATHQYSCASSPSSGKNNHALELTVKNQAIVSIKTSAGVNGGAFSQEKWGIQTETPVKVATIMHSPNHWDDNQTGNKHWFFILEGCKNDQPTRGIYNEFLSSKLEEHRKVFEILGDKTKCQPTDDQLSGIGFSSTKSESVLVNVTGDKIRKSYNIIF